VEEAEENDERVSVSRRSDPVDVSVAVRRHQRRGVLQLRRRRRWRRPARTPAVSGRRTLGHVRTPPRRSRTVPPSSVRRRRTDRRTTGVDAPVARRTPRTDVRRTAGHWPGRRRSTSLLARSDGCRCRPGGV